MKKLLLSLIITGTSIYGFAQATLDFETWIGSGASIEPNGWVSENALTGLPGNPQSCFQATAAADVHGGASAMKIVSVTMTINPSPSTLPNPIGMAATGALSGSTLKFGFPYTQRPTTASFWAKYTPAANDSAGCLLVLMNGALHDTIAIGTWAQGAAINAYAQQTMTLLYNPAYASITPDSMALVFTSTRLFNPNHTFCLNCGKVGSTLYVDDITFAGQNAVNEILTSNGVSLYPNPANDIVHISADASDAVAAIVYDAAGRKVASSSAFELMNSSNNKAGIINTSFLAIGLYSYAIVDKNGSALRAGKFNVVR